MDGDSPTQEGSVPDKAAQVAARKRAIKERVKKQIVFIAECTIRDVVIDEKGIKGSILKIQLSCRPSRVHALNNWELVQFHYRQITN
jgi:hypothetical protein